MPVGTPAAAEPTLAAPASTAGRGGEMPKKAPRSMPACTGESSDSDSGLEASAGRNPRSKGEFHCQVVWCDQRAFKEFFTEFKSQLAEAAQMPVKAHKTAEKCMRLLQKKKR